jgi:hypothetical protein
MLGFQNTALFSFTQFCISSDMQSAKVFTRCAFDGRWQVFCPRRQFLLVTSYLVPSLAVLRPFSEDCGGVTHCAYMHPY